MDLDELERLLKAATAGPWIGAGPSFGDPLPRYTTSMVTEWDDDDGFRTICEFGYAHHDEENEANAALIAALRNHAEELIRDARRYRWLRGEIDRTDVPPLGRVVWKLHSDRESCEWTDFATAQEVDAAIEAAIAQEGKG